jgi:hypothetical protein
MAAGQHFLTIAAQTFAKNEYVSQIATSLRSWEKVNFLYTYTRNQKCKLKTERT